MSNFMTQKEAMERVNHTMHDYTSDMFREILEQMDGDEQLEGRFSEWELNFLDEQIHKKYEMTAKQKASVIQMYFKMYGEVPINP